MPRSILIIDVDFSSSKVIHEILGKHFSVHSARSAIEGFEKIQTLKPRLILLSPTLPDMPSESVLKRLKEDHAEIPLIALMDPKSPPRLVEAFAVRGVDMVQKPFDNGSLERIVRKVSRSRGVHTSLLRQRIVGKSPQMDRVWELVEKYGPTDLPILILGETGTGKELIARAIHSVSTFNRGPFVPLDCAVLPETLFESELFGHEKGSFTGADKKRVGRLEYAAGGTLFFDELGNIPLPYQAKLLRVLQESQFVPVGGLAEKDVHARFLSATNVDLHAAIEGGRFRDDLFYRLRGCIIQLPALRDRCGDIEVLAWHFLEMFKEKIFAPELTFSSDTLALLKGHSWPGNIRQLERAIYEAAIAADDVILPKHLQLLPRRERAAPAAETEISIRITCDFSQPFQIKEVSRQAALEVEGKIIRELRRSTSMNSGDRAKFLGLDRKSLRAKEKTIFPTDS